MRLFWRYFLCLKGCPFFSRFNSSQELFHAFAKSCKSLDSSVSFRFFFGFVKRISRFTTFGIVRVFELNVFRPETGFLNGPTRYIQTFEVIFDVKCVTLKKWTIFETFALYPNLGPFIRKRLISCVSSKR